MSLSNKSIETLIDLVEIKLGCMEVWDREDRRAARDLEKALKELKAIDSTAAPRRRRTARTGATVQLAH